jgi:uncharacterized membrane protein YraQ (UPF0718 family)
MLFAAMVGVLVFANWARGGDVRAAYLCCPGGLRTLEAEGHVVSRTPEAVTIVRRGGEEVRIPAEQLRRIEPVAANSAYDFAYLARWALAGLLLAALAAMLAAWFKRGELGEWLGSTWGFAKQILPLLLIGVLAAGLLLGRPEAGGQGLIPASWVHRLVGGNSLRANLMASVAGAVMYFATLTEVPILHGLLGAGMGKGPALALLLAGPALSLPNMLVIRSVMGTRKTLVYVALVVVMATVSGVVFGNLFG